jgi:transposase-like protein
MGRQRKKHARSEKLEAIRQIEDGEKTKAEVARDLGVTPNAISRWLSEWSEKGDAAFPGHGRQSGSAAELAALKREVETLKEENTILKKAAAYFAKDLV